MKKMSIMNEILDFRTSLLNDLEIVCLKIKKTIFIIYENLIIKYYKNFSSYFIWFIFNYIENKIRETLNTFKKLLNKKKFEMGCGNSKDQVS